MPLELPFDCTDFTNYQHPPCMFILWYASLLFVKVVDKVAELLPEGGITLPELPQGGGGATSSKTTEPPPPTPPPEAAAPPPAEEPPAEAPAEEPPAETPVEEPTEDSSEK